MRVIRPVVLSVLLGLSFASGQWLETTLDVPERFCGSLLSPHVATYNPANGRVYIGGDGGSDVVVLDATTGAKVGKIPVGSAVNDVCCDTLHNRAFVATAAGKLVVLDGDADTILAVTTMPGEATDLCYDPQEDKIYCSHSYELTVVDGVTYDIFATIPLPLGSPRGLWCFPSREKLYCTCTTGEEVLVIDCNVDTVIDTIPVGYWGPSVSAMTRLTTSSIRPTSAITISQSLTPRLIAS